MIPAVFFDPQSAGATAGSSNYVLIAGLLVLAYLIGGIPFGYLLVRLKTGQDVRAMGSGNIGATNVLRTTGRGWGVLTLVLDIAKGYLAVWLMRRATGDAAWFVGAAVVAVLLGHAFPVYLKFKGGKAMASFVGAALCLAPAAVGVCALVFVLVVAAWRYISLGSIVSAALFPLVFWLLNRPDWPLVAATALASALVIWRHSSNIQRLRAGTENVFHLGGNKP
jgi:glycerol-3-phosphate acyltransferase PlsY